MSIAHELAWCAGFFDGEGFVTIGKRHMKYKERSYYSYYLRIGVNHVAPEPLYELQKVLGGAVRPSKSYGNRHPRHSWSMSCSAASEALKRMMPYFRNKNNVAEIGLEFQNTMQKNKKERSEELVLYQAMLKDKIMTLNAKD